MENDAIRRSLEAVVKEVIVTPTNNQASSTEGNQKPSRYWLYKWNLKLSTCFLPLINNKCTVFISFLPWHEKGSKNTSQHCGHS